MPLPDDYPERVYAGVLGKIIGVYLGRPFEGWTYERISAELGEIWYYVHERLGQPLIVTDDDITGTFTFLQALPDYGNSRDLSAAQIGQSWLNYILENRTILWWGGLGKSTEHTAFLRLSAGIPAPRSGSIALNGSTIAEQIGAQIFIDGWAMVAPGDPALAAELASRAASVSHDGAAADGARLLAAMEAQAFVEEDIDRLIDCGLRFVPADSIIARLVADIRAWHAAAPDDWRAARAQIAARYGYDRYPGNCHIVPNHALIILGLLYGAGDFQRSLMIANTAGWDTDCNSGNLGCLLGIRGGLRALEEGPDWRGPVADRLFLPAADGGRAISDAVRETFAVANIGRALAGHVPLAPKNGARFHFSLPGAVQGWQSATPDTLRVEHAEDEGGHSLALRFAHLAPGRAAHASTPTFIPPAAIAMPGYSLLATPTLYPGQHIRAAVRADAANSRPVACGLVLEAYGGRDTLEPLEGPSATLAPGAQHEFVWRVPDTGGAPIATVGLALRADTRADGSIFLDFLTWDGAPDVTLKRPAAGGTLWRRAWLDAVDHFDERGARDLRIIQNHGTGLLFQGTREWTDYAVSATVTPGLVERAGLAARVQGLRRFYALLLAPNGTAQLVKSLDGETVLAEAPFAWEYEMPYLLRLDVQGQHLRAWVGDELLLEVEDTLRPLLGGGAGLICTAGLLNADAVRVGGV
jgi:ADP-ribosylglycohydrolase